ncbi:hypothetical protein BI330_00025 [Mycobacterium sp. CBMA 623]|nr:hypothetical protein [Mycobacteroides sp. CBMA 326]
MWIIPLVATRLGDSPPGVVPDPAGVPVVASSPQTTPGTIQGFLRVDFDMANAKVNGATQPPRAKEPPIWWAASSKCSSAGCAATMVVVDETNHGEAIQANVFHLLDGRWVGEPTYEQKPCAKFVPGSSGTFTLKRSWSIDEQPAGVLSGMSTMELLGNCVTQRMQMEAPITITRTGDVPGGVVLADPAYFLPT